MYRVNYFCIYKVSLPNNVHLSVIRVSVSLYVRTYVSVAQLSENEF